MYIVVHEYEISVEIGRQVNLNDDQRLIRMYTNQSPCLLLGVLGIHIPDFPMNNFYQNIIDRNHTICRA